MSATHLVTPSTLVLLPLAGDKSDKRFVAGDKSDKNLDAGDKNDKSLCAGDKNDKKRFHNPVGELRVT